MKTRNRRADLSSFALRITSRSEMANAIRSLDHGVLGHSLPLNGTTILRCSSINRGNACARRFTSRRFLYAIYIRTTSFRKDTHCQFSLSKYLSTFKKRSIAISRPLFIKVLPSFFFFFLYVRD